MNCRLLRPGSVHHLQNQRAKVRQVSAFTTNAALQPGYTVRGLCWERAFRLHTGSIDHTKGPSPLRSINVRRLTIIRGLMRCTGQPNSVVTGVAIVVFWPAAFFVGGDRGNAAELGRLKGEADALEQVSIKKNCGIQFRQG